MSKRILIAEDSSVILNLTKKILLQQHYEIIAAKNGEEVLSKLEVEDIDLILMDINIPKLDGVECTKKIRALSDQTKSSIPIFAITGNAKNYTEEEFLSIGINEYLPKPIDFDHLVDLVAKYTS